MHAADVHGTVGQAAISLKDQPAFESSLPGLDQQQVLCALLQAIGANFVCCGILLTQAGAGGGGCGVSARAYAREVYLCLLSLG